MLKELDVQNQIAEVVIWLSKANAVFVFLLILWWCLSTDTSAAFLGGVNMSDLLFQWHPILMTLGMFSLFTFAILSFRSSSADKMTSKSYHAWLFGFSVACIIFGMVAVVKDNNSEGWANLFSLHSMIGLAAMVLYGSNFLLGLIFFYLPVSVKQRNNYKPLHIAIGIASFCAAVLAFETGIMEMNVWLDCNYYTLTPDNDPAKNYHLLPAGCQLSNGIGVLIMIGAVLTLFGLFTWQPLQKEIDHDRVDYNLPTYSLQDVAKHTGVDCEAGDIWIVVRNKVYNVTPFLKQHPGGSSAITMNAGTDTTEDFEAVHSPAAWKMLEHYYIGNIDRTIGTDPNHTSIHDEENQQEGNASNGSQIALNPRKRIAFALAAREQLSPDSLRLRFALQGPHHQLGLPVGQHMFFFAKIKGKTIMRAYTPVSSDHDVGFFELVIKVYGKTDQYPDGGLMSQHMGSLQVGDTIDVQGPVGDVIYEGRGKLIVGNELQEPVHQFVMLCGGTGITPMFQIISAVLRSKEEEDSTKLQLIFSNRTEADILMKDELDALAAAHPTRFEIKYFLSRPENAVQWKASGNFVGRLCHSELKQLIPTGGVGTGRFALLCGPQGLLDDVCKPSLLALGYPEEHVIYF